MTRRRGVIGSSVRTMNDICKRCLLYLMLVIALVWLVGCSGDKDSSQDTVDIIIEAPKPTYVTGSGDTGSSDTVASSEK